MPSHLPVLFFVGLMVLAFAWFGWSTFRRIRRRGGVAGALADADIARTLVEVDAASPGMRHAKCRVHAFSGGGPERAVGTELMLRTVASYDSMTAALSAGEARQLAALLRQAIGEDAPASPRARRPARDEPD